MTHHQTCKLLGSLASRNLDKNVEILKLQEQLTCQEVAITGLLEELKRERATRIYQSEGREN